MGSSQARIGQFFWSAVVYVTLPVWRFGRPGSTQSAPVQLHPRFDLSRQSRDTPWHEGFMHSGIAPGHCFLEVSTAYAKGRGQEASKQVLRRGKRPLDIRMPRDFVDWVGRTEFRTRRYVRIWYKSKRCRNYPDFRCQCIW